MAKVMIIEDDESVGKALLREVNRAGHDGRVSTSLEEGKRVAAEFMPDAICLDVNLPDGNGLDAILSFVESPGHPEVLVLSGFASADDAAQAIRVGAWDYLHKGQELKGFTNSLRRALDYHARQEQAVPRALDLGKMVGRSPAMKACYNRLAQASASEAKVLITGESGTGKELAAHAIHANSSRRDKGFVVVDCAALPDELVESVLFGHRRGSFTGAFENREGLVEQADGGTLFLDEVAELPLSAQRAFLRTLQEKNFRPVGGDHEVRSDFRLVAATHRDLDKMVAEGTFRADLLFRLRALLVQLPPLRERGDDVREIALDAVARVCQREHIGTKGLSPEFLAALASYSWPGNVRELINAVEQAVAQAWNHETLLPIHLPTELRAKVAKSSFVVPDAEPARPASESHPSAAPRDSAPATLLEAPHAAAPAPSPGPLPSLEEHRAAATRHYLEELLRATGADVAEACRVARLSRSRFYALLKEHGLARR